MKQQLKHSLSRRAWIVGLSVAMMASLPACGGGEDVSALQTTWSTSMLDFNNPGLLPPPATPSYFQSQTLRQRMRIGSGGRAVRLQVSNAFGVAPLTIDGIRVARPAGSVGAAQTDIDPATDKPVTFSGSSSVTVPVGTEIWSDEVALDVPGRTDLIVSIQVANQTQVATYHANALQQGAVAPGSALSSASLGSATTISSYYWISKIDVRNDEARGSIVVLGDSISDGSGTAANTNTRWPNMLDARLASSPGLRNFSVINAGIQGNRILTNGVGPRALDRFARDVRGATSAKAVIVLLGVNDISIGDTITAQAVSSQQITDGLATLVRDGRAAGLKVYLATIMPYKGWARFPWTEASEAKRQAVNAWIRAAGNADGLIDFDATMRSPTDPLVLNPAFDSGDRLHPNAAGTQAMANAVDLALFAGL